ncbi:MAG: hypothetical protein RL199_582 [Pseudomonadota bacterium]|jgi:ATP-dependent helicase HrpB
MDALPIDPLLPELTATLSREPSLVLEAPPGAGKTTRVPRALLDAGFAAKGEILVLEPRRLATRLSARRVASELGEPVGRTVGYQVRFEEVASSATRIRFVTEGVLTRRLLGDPNLAGVAAVLLDEFHERHLQGDLGLALLRRLQQTTRPDLKLCVMSATLEAAPLSGYLAAPTLRSEGRRFEVSIEHAAQEDTRRLEGQVTGAVKRLCAAGLDGDVLVFLPGAGEIRRAMDALAPFAASAELELHALHGELSPEEQDRAIRRSDKRKVILATNVAETSVTIDGVVAVVDSGLARQASHSPWTGFPTLKVAKVSRSSAVQRAGRAGRTRPGRCLRLYTKADFDARRQHDDSEIRRLDLTQTLLELASADIAVGALPWFEVPPSASLEASRTLLRHLGAIDATDRATAEGRRMASLPVHPRLARLAMEADRRRAGREGCTLAALLGERELRERPLFGSSQATTSHDSDAVDTLELFLQWQSRGASSDAARSLGLQLGAVKNVERARVQLERSLRPAVSTGTWRERDVALRQAILAAFPDRVGKRRTPGGRDLVLSGGGSAQLAESSGVHQAALVVTVDAEERREGTRGGIVVRSASAIEEEWLLDVAPDALGDAVDVQWHEGRERAEAVSRMTYGAIVLDERPLPDADPALLSAVLHEAAKAKGIRAFTDAERIDKLLERVRFAAKSFPEAGIAEPTDDVLDRAVAKLCEGRRSFAELREANLESELASALGADARLDRLAPESVVLPGGRKVKVNYDGHAPWVESRLQDFFGMKDGPKLGGRVPLVLHLLAPNYRAQQVTTDLSGFWARHYPAVRKELMRQYPRHSWPEDPLTAAPPVPKGR